MDPVFLRHAVNDAEGERHSEDDPPPMARVAWLVTARGVALRILRRSTGR
jgi:hypothetical protein